MIIAAEVFPLPDRMRLIDQSGISFLAINIAQLLFANIYQVNTYFIQ
jgi:hypothetical protein